MIGSVNNGNIMNRMSYPKVNAHANSKASEEANESMSEKMAETRNQSQTSASSQAKNGALKANPGSNTTAGSIIDVHI